MLDRILAQLRAEQRDLLEQADRTALKSRQDTLRHRQEGLNTAIVEIIFQREGSSYLGHSVE